MCKHLPAWVLSLSPSPTHRNMWTFQPKLSFRFGVSCHPMIKITKIPFIMEFSLKYVHTYSQFFILYTTRKHFLKRQKSTKTISCVGCCTGQKMSTHNTSSVLEHDNDKGYLSTLVPNQPVKHPVQCPASLVIHSF